MANSADEKESSEADEFKDYSYADLCSIVKRQRELLDITFQEMGYGELYECCIIGCVDVDMSTPHHGAERVNRCETCRLSFCISHRGKDAILSYAGVSCSICGDEGVDFMCSGCVETHSDPPVCMGCVMKARLKKVKAWKRTRYSSKTNSHDVIVQATVVSEAQSK